MKLLIDDIKLYKSRDLIPCACLNCNSTFFKRKNEIMRALKGTRKCTYCSIQCSVEHTLKVNSYNLTCDNCNKEFTKLPSQISIHNFCSQSCSAKYTNKNKKYGFRRSKFEKYFCERFHEEYPSINVIYSERSLIGYELDIYFPQLKTAVEINGIIHYKPIYGLEKFNRIKEIDNLKNILCEEKGISLITYNVSHIKNFTKSILDSEYNILKELIWASNLSELNR